MDKKIGKSILLGMIVIAMIFSLIGVLYATLNNIAYAAENNDFYMCNEVDDKIINATVNLGSLSCYNNELKKAAKLKLPENTTIYDIDVYINGKKLEKTYQTILTNKESYAGESKNVSVYSGENYDIELKYNQNEEPVCYIIGKEKGKNETITFKISSKGKEYETSLKVKVVDSDFRFATDGNRIKEYTGKYAFEIGKEYGFNFKLPSGYSKDDVSFEIIGENNGCIEIDNNNKSVTAKKEGNGRLCITLKKDNDIKSVSYTNFEVVEKINENATNKTSTTTSSKNNTTISSKTNSGVKSIKFSENKRIVKLSESGSVKINEAIITTGIKKDEIKYTVSDPSIASVTKDNYSTLATINIKKVGTFTLTATYTKDNSIKAEKEIVVHASSLNLFEQGKNTKINEENISLDIGETFILKAFEEENEVDSSLLKYTSSNEKVCTIDESGKITALKKGSSTIKVMIEENTKTYAKIYVKVLATNEEKMLSQPFSFPVDENGKVINAKGENALIVGKTYTYDLVRPEGTENYEVVYSCSKTGLLEINGNKITPLKVGTGNLIAKMKIGNQTKTASMSFEIFASDVEKNKETAENTKYFSIDFSNNNMIVEKGNITTLKPTIVTNMKKSEYSLNWSSSNENVIKVDKNGRITAKEVGTATVTVSFSKNSSIKAEIDIEVKEKVVLVSSLKFNTNLEKNGSNYLIKTNENVTMNFDVKPENATLKDYSIEVDDKENFIVQGKTVIALKEGVKTKLTARSLDTGNKVATITLQSVMSEEELASLQLITDNKEITIQVGETLKFKKSANTTISKSGNISYKTDNNNVVSIIGNKIGTAEIRVKQSNKTVAVIPVNIVAQKSEKDEVAVSSIELAIDPKTKQTKNYTTDYPLVVDKCYNVIDTLSIYPTNATNKDINVEVSDKSAFTVTSEGNIIANKANANAVVTLSSVSNPEVVTTFNISSVSAGIKSIKFAKDYVGENSLTLEHIWGFNLIITLDNGETLDPTSMADPYNNEEYQKYLKQIVIESSDTSLLEIDSGMGAKVVVGKNGTGTLSAYVRSNTNIKTSAKFETVGINEDTTIKSAKFAKSNYEITLEEGGTEFCPIITLANNFVYDPSKDYGSENSVAGADDYRNYVEQLMIEVINPNNSKKVVEIGNDSDRKLSIIHKNEGTCKLVLKLKSTGEELSQTTLEVKKASTTSSTTGITGTVTEINHATTTSNKNLKITDIKFVQRSYTIEENYGVGFKPTIKLSDGSTISHESKDQDTYLYYVSQTELFFANESGDSTIDFGIAEIKNEKAPSGIVPLKSGKFNLAIGLKNSTTQTIYDMVPITINI